MSGIDEGRQDKPGEPASYSKMLGPATTYEFSA